MRYVHTMLRTNCTNVCRVTWEYTPSDSRTPERSTTHSCESSRAPKNSAIKSKNRSLKAMAHQTEFSCRPCLSHLRQEPQITQEFQRLLPLPLSNRVERKRHSQAHHVGTRKRITFATQQPKGSQSHPCRRRGWREKPALARTTLGSKQQEEASRTPCRFQRSLHLQVIHAAVCAIRTARTPRLRFVSHQKLHPKVRAAVGAYCAVSIRTQTTSLASTRSVQAT